jgi:D-alanine-D-alanine ligase
MIDRVALPAFPLPETPTPAWLLTGGMSPEHEVSLSSAMTVLQNLERGRFRVRPVCIRRDGRWCLAPEFLTAPLEEAEARALHAEFTSPSPRWDCLTAEEALAALRRDAPALAFIVMHGPQGEDGRMQALLEEAGVNYTGSGVEASALAMDKRRTQRLLAQRGLTVARFAVIERENAVHAAVEASGFPCVVKPVAGGSSVGVTPVRERASLMAAVGAAFELDPEAVLIEELLEGTEVTCGVLDLPDGETVALAPTEILPCAGPFFDYRAKYTPGACEEITPARVSEAMTVDLRRLAVETHRIVGARGFSRTDFIIRGETPHILEINTIPGLTPTSLLPQGAAAVGIDFRTMMNVIAMSALTNPISSGPRSVL